MPTISVIIPVYNVEKYVSQTLESIINQTFKDIEIICVDDCGNDGSIRIVREYAEKDSRIKIIRHEQNKGLGAARNTAVKKASGKYVYFIDSDDYADPSFLEKAHDKIEKTGFASVWTCVKSYFEQTKTFGRDSYFQKLLDCEEGEIKVTPENMTEFPVLTLNKLFSLDFIKKNNFFFPEGVLYEDEEFYYKFYALSENVYLMKEELVTYRRRENSIMGKTKAGAAKREDICKAAVNIYKFFSENGLLEKYNGTLLEFIYIRMKHSVKEKAYRKRMISAMREMIKSIHFPEKYIDDGSRGYGFLSVMSEYEPSKKLKNFISGSSFRLLLFLVNFCPSSKTRKKIRQNINKRFF